MRRKIKWLAGSLVVLSVLAFSCAPADTGDEAETGDEVSVTEAGRETEPETMMDEVIEAEEDQEIETETMDETGEMVDGREIKVTPEGVKYLVEPGKIIGGGPPKDGIPSIDDPKFVSLEEADTWIEDNELVITITYKGEVRVYPLQIMVWHEIVNEVIGGDPLLITY